MWAERPAVGEGSAPNGPGWRLRVVPNRFPAVAPDAILETVPPPKHSLHIGGGGTGHHEVVIESDRHDARIDASSDERVGALLHVYRDRAAALSARPGVGHVIVFRNGGPRSGASLTHPHSQIAALPKAPSETVEEGRRLAEHHVATGRCLACDRLEAELDDGARLLTVTDEWVSFLPYAGRFPAQICVTPRSHAGAFALSEDDALARLAPVVRDAVSRLAAAYDAPSFNWTLHASSIRPAAGLHWRLDILPRMAQVGGFELSTGTFINGIPPEQAARTLRDVR